MGKVGEKRPSRKTEMKKKYRTKFTQKYNTREKDEKSIERYNRAIIAKYRKDFPKPNNQTCTESSDSITKKRVSAYEMARQHYEKVKEERKLRKEIAIKEKVERSKALKEYKEKKKLRYKGLKKTKKGQPVMKGALERLYEKIVNATKDK